MKDKSTTTKLMDKSIAVVEGNALAGAIVFWDLTGGVSQADIAEQLMLRGISGDEAPEPASPRVALRRAMARHVGAARLYRKAGVTYVMREDAVEDDDLDLGLKLRAQWGVRLNALGMPEFVGRISDVDAALLRQLYMTELVTLSTDDVGAWLLALVRRADALCLRACGGTYFIPRDALDTFAEYADALHASSGCRVRFIPAMHSTATLEAVVDNLTSEVAAFVDATSKDLADGIGEIAIDNRLRATRRMLEKVARFESLLGHKLDALRNSLTSLDGIDVQATLLQQEDDNDND